ncbi:hypothetical protein AB0M46_06815 [Dactylosporangium sp. NPDC051485]|uniref:hypothetical protein n=1 Tax=Dactylosporangium sp. NPDC051485 TaxID=3154846 RepID=UPI003433D0F0
MSDLYCGRTALPRIRGHAYSTRPGHPGVQVAVVMVGTVTGAVGRVLPPPAGPGRLSTLAGPALPAMRRRLLLCTRAQSPG